MSGSEGAMGDITRTLEDRLPAASAWTASQSGAPAADVRNWKLRRELAFVFALLTGCGAAPDAGASVDDELAHPPGEPTLTPSCTRLDDVGDRLEAQLLQTYGTETATSLCVVEANQQLASLGTRSCTLTEPRGFALQGCADWYECDGCLVELRGSAEGTFALMGLSDGAACADIAGRYELVPSIDLGSATSCAK